MPYFVRKMKLYVLLVLYTVGVNTHRQVPGAECNRQCDGVHLECLYTLHLDRFYTLGPNCFGCESGIYDDCRRPVCIPGDGNERSVKAFNGSIPGPAIIACEGDIITVHVACKLDPETCSVHWHGMHQKGSQSSDGVPTVTQWPILPNDVYTYRFIAQSGTHFYHSHSGLQRADGAYGHLIIAKPKAEEFYGRSYVFDLPQHQMSLLEFFPLMSDEYANRYMRTSVFYDQDVSSILVNGHGATPTNRIPPYKIIVTQGRTYRIRMINACNIVCPIEMSIESHQMFVFNSDGNDFRGVTVDKLTLTNGERYDFILNANRAIKKYAIRFEGSLICNSVRTIATLEYVGSNAKQVLAIAPSPIGGSRLNCVTRRSDPACIPLHRLIAIEDVRLGEPHETYLITFDQEMYARPRYRSGVRSEELFTPYMNNIAHVAPKVPALFETPEDTCDYDRPLNCDRGLCECTHVVKFGLWKVIDLVLCDLGTALELAHPIHIHGYSMLIMGIEQMGSNVTRQLIQNRINNGTLLRNSSRPILKDTVAVPDGGCVVGRFLTDNPGYWLLHCHVDFHTEEGMQLILKTIE